MRYFRRPLLPLFLLFLFATPGSFAQEKSPPVYAIASEENAKPVLLRDISTDYVYRLELLPRYRSERDPFPTFFGEKLETIFGDVKIAVSQVPVAVCEGKNPYPAPRDSVLAAGPFGLADFFPPEASLPGAGKARQAIESLISARAALTKKGGFSLTYLLPAQPGGFTWEDSDIEQWGEDFAFQEQDRMVASAQMRELNVLPIISPWKHPRKISNYVPVALEAYKRFVSAAVRRYDGDLSQDYDLLRYPILYYQLEVNPAVTYHSRYREGFMNPHQYAQVLKATYEALKRANRSASLILGAIDVNPDSTLSQETLNYLRALGEKDVSRYFDLFAINLTIRQFDPDGTRRILSQIHSLLRTDKPFVVSKLIIESPPPAGRNDWERSADDARQALTLLHTYLWLLSHNCRKIFWGNLQDAGFPSRAPFAGLVTREGNFKLACYTHRKLAELLSGCDLADIKEISDGKDGLYVYRLKRLDLKRSLFLIWQMKSAGQQTHSRK